MKPLFFDEVTKSLEKPPDMTSGECKPLPVYNDGKTCISKWGLSIIERLHCLFSGYVWLRVRGGVTQPPVIIEAKRTVFK